MDGFSNIMTALFRNTSQGSRAMSLVVLHLDQTMCLTWRRHILNIC